MLLRVNLSYKRTLLQQLGILTMFNCSISLCLRHRAKEVPRIPYPNMTSPPPVNLDHTEMCQALLPSSAPINRTSRPTYIAEYKFLYLQHVPLSFRPSFFFLVLWFRKQSAKELYCTSSARSLLNEGDCSSGDQILMSQSIPDEARTGKRQSSYNIDFFTDFLLARVQKSIVILTWVVRVRLQTVNYMIISLQKHQVLSCMSVPDENMATVGATHYKVISPETRLLYLYSQR